jgi:hypothetical protein
VDGGGRKRDVAESNTQLMQTGDDVARCVKASHVCSLMVVNDEGTSPQCMRPLKWSQAQIGRRIPMAAGRCFGDSRLYLPGDSVDEALGNIRKREARGHLAATLQQG